MDLDGQWNPPESWPESSPPLPGWVRDNSGMWSAPTTGDLEDTVVPTTRPVPEGSAAAEDSPTIPALPTIQEPVAAASMPSMKRTVEPSLRFAETQAAPQPDEEAARMMRRATNAAIIAAVTASMLAAGIVVLLALL